MNVIHHTLETVNAYAYPIAGVGLTVAAVGLAASHTPLIITGLCLAALAALVRYLYSPRPIPSLPNQNPPLPAAPQPSPVAAAEAQPHNSRGKAATLYPPNEPPITVWLVDGCEHRVVGNQTLESYSMTLSINNTLYKVTSPHQSFGDPTHSFIAEPPIRFEFQLLQDYPGLIEVKETSPRRSRTHYIDYQTKVSFWYRNDVQAVSIHPYPLTPLTEERKNEIIRRFHSELALDLLVQEKTSPAMVGIDFQNCEIRVFVPPNTFGKVTLKNSDDLDQIVFRLSNISFHFQLRTWGNLFYGINHSLAKRIFHRTPQQIIDIGLEINQSQPEDVLPKDLWMLIASYIHHFSPDELTRLLRNHQLKWHPTAKNDPSVPDLSLALA